MTESGPTQHGQQMETVACLASSTTAAKGTYNRIVELEQRPQNSRFRFVNFGVGGDLSFDTVKRLDRVVRIQLERVIVLIGTNDILASVFPNFRRITRVWKRLPEEPSPARFRENIELVTHKLQHDTKARIALCSLAPVGEDPHSNDAVQSRLNQLFGVYNGIIRDISSTTGRIIFSFTRSSRARLTGPRRSGRSPGSRSRRSTAIISCGK